MPTVGRPTERETRSEVAGMGAGQGCACSCVRAFTPQGRARPGTDGAQAAELCAGTGTHGIVHQRVKTFGQHDLTWGEVRLCVIRVTKRSTGTQDKPPTGAILGDGNIMLLAPYFHFLTL